MYIVPPLLVYGYWTTWSLRQNSRTSRHKERAATAISLVSNLSIPGKPEVCLHICSPVWRQEPWDTGEHETLGLCAGAVGMHHVSKEGIVTVKRTVQSLHGWNVVVMACYACKRIVIHGQGSVSLVWFLVLLVHRGDQGSCEYNLALAQFSELQRNAQALLQRMISWQSISCRLQILSAHINSNIWKLVFDLHNSLHVNGYPLFELIAKEWGILETCFVYCTLTKCITKWSRNFSFAYIPCGCIVQYSQ